MFTKIINFARGIFGIFPPLPSVFFNLQLNTLELHKDGLLATILSSHEDTMT
jgi:hypothetical protein